VQYGNATRRSLTHRFPTIEYSSEDGTTYCLLDNDGTIGPSSHSLLLAGVSILCSNALAVNIYDIACLRRWFAGNKLVWVQTNASTMAVPRSLVMSHEIAMKDYPLNLHFKNVFGHKRRTRQRRLLSTLKIHRDC